MADADDAPPGRSDEDQTDEDAPVPEAVPPATPGSDPTPMLMQAQFMTPSAPLNPGVGVRMFPVQPPASTVPATWATDPAGRHELRWWDGTAWTVHVADGGVVAQDPL
jgi:hypothetical protein